MKVLLINGSTPEDTGLQTYLDAFAHQRTAMGDIVRQLALADMKFHECIGCYNCWLKTPGLCCFKDDHEEILKGAVWADQVIWASPVRMGFVTARVKKAVDRMLPVVHPFLKMSGDRMTHYLRYEKTAPNGLLLQAGPELNADALAGIKAMYSRFAFVAPTEKTPEEVANETHRF